MLLTIISTLPLVAVILLGYALKRAKIFSSDDGSMLMKLNFYVATPALIFQSLTHSQLYGRDLLTVAFPLALCAVALCLIFLLRATIFRKTPRKLFGSFAAGVAIANTGFLIPFVQNLHGADGLAQVALFDILGSILTFTVVYAIAAYYGKDKPNWRYILSKVLMSPPLWAIVLAFLVRFLGWELPDAANNLVGMVAGTAAPVILLALGLKLSFKFKQPKLIAAAVLVRMVFGFVVSLIFAKIFGIDGVAAEVILLIGAAPIGFNSITFAEMENLDAKYAAAQVSLALILAIIFIPVLISAMPWLI